MAPFRRVARTLTGLAIAIASVGCGSQRAFVTSVHPQVSSMRLVDRVAADASAPALAPAAVEFLDARHGFLVTTGGGHWVPKTGWARPVEPARIQHTTDGGLTWRTVWSAPGIALSQLAFAGAGRAIAFGSRSAMARDSTQTLGPLPRAPVLVASRDGGRTWRPARAPTGVDTIVAAGTSWYGVGAGRLVRLDSPFGRWHRVSSPPGVSVAVFLSRRVGFAGGRCRGGQQLWRTDDAAATWTPVPRTCGPPYLALGSAGRRTLFSTQGYSAADGPYPRVAQVLRRSTDGGATWPVRMSTLHWPTVTTLGFTDAQDGWAVSHESDQGFDYWDAHVTADGGRTWRRRRIPALPSAFARPARAWAVDGLTAVVWRTSDGGASWHATAAPRQVSVDQLDVATPHELIVRTPLGALRSRDGGRTWTSVKPVSERAAARENGRLAFVPSAGDYSETALVRTRGRWRPLHPPPRVFTFGDAWFTDASHGILAGGDASAADVRARAYATSDGGRTWRLVGLPPGACPTDLAAVGPSALVVERSGKPLLVSVDTGRHWSAIRVPLRYAECTVQRPRSTTWVLCADVITGHGVRSALLQTNGGRAWIVLTARTPMAARGFLATSDDEAWVAAWPPGDPDEVAALWHTVDGGRTWQRVRVALDPHARVDYRLPLPR